MPTTRSFPPLSDEAQRPVRSIVGLASAFLVVLCATTARAAPDAQPFPRFDIDAMCHVRANYAFAATLGQADAGQEFALCAARERSMRDVARTIWAASSVRARTECGDLAHSAYGTLARCLGLAIPAP